MGSAIILLLFFFFFLGVPISFSLGLTSLIGLVSSGYPLDVVVQRIFTGIDNYSLIAVALFIFAGDLMSEGGISRRLVDFADAIIGHFPAGLAMVSILACMFFAGITGSAIAATAAIGGLMIPVMTEQKYAPTFSASLLACAGSIGPIIPPSIPLLVFGQLANASVARLFVGGFVPGILMGIALMVYSYFVGKKRNYRGRDEFAGWGEVWDTGRKAILALITPIIIIGGIVSGVFTATESGAIAVMYSLLVGMFVYKELTWEKVWQLLKKSAVSTGTVLIVVACASLFVWYLTINQIPQAVAEAMMTFIHSRFALLMVINIILLIVGTFIDTISAVVIFGPLFLPLTQAFGIDVIHYGLILAVNLTIGMCTPPLGVDLFVSSAIAKVSIREMWHDLVPLLGVLILVLILITYVPSSVLWLPNLLGIK
ncbi:MAG: TRAP transporter large permease [Firmicutes bacterium]|nr:TRAP transporter large permease [Bacillota bacterium]